MVTRIVSLLNRSVSGLHQAAILLGVFSLGSHILGLLRDRLLAHNFGAGNVLDVYYAAFKIPDYIYVTIASLVSVTVLLPFIVDRINSEDKKSALELLNSLLTVFVVAIGLVSAVIFIFMPTLAPWVAPGFSADQYDTLILLSRILLLSPILLGLSNLFGSITQTYEKFFVYAFAPLLYNIGIILGIIFLYPLWGITGLVWGVILGAFLHFAIQIPVVFSVGLKPSLTSKPNLVDVWKVISTSLPRTVALSAHSFVLIILTALASLMDVGSITIFNFSYNLQSVPMVIIGVSYSVAAFPALTKLITNGDKKKFIDQVSSAARHIIFWSLPVTSLFIILRAQIVRTILGSGAFDWESTRLTAAALALFVVSVAAQSLVHLFVRGYYASGNTKKPLAINLISSSLIVLGAFWSMRLFEVNAGFRYFFEALFKVDDITGTSILMLPFAFSIGMVINAIIFWIYFQKDFHAFTGELTKTLKQSFYAAVIMGFGAFQSLRIFDDVFDINTLFGIFMQGLTSGLVGIFVGILVLKALRNKELVDVWQVLHKKFWKTTPIQPSPDDLV